MALLSCVVLTTASSAQAPRTPDAVRAAMTALLRAEAAGGDSVRIALDSAAVWRDFVTCRDVNGARVCALRDGKPVTVIHVTMVTPDSAEVELQRFRMIDTWCPHGTPINPPQITGNMVGTAWWDMRYVDGRWVGTRSSMVVTC